MIRFIIIINSHVFHLLESFKRTRSVLNVTSVVLSEVIVSHHQIMFSSFDGHDPLFPPVPWHKAFDVAFKTARIQSPSHQAGCLLSETLLSPSLLSSCLLTAQFVAQLFSLEGYLDEPNLIAFAVFPTQSGRLSHALGQFPRKLKNLGTL